jgi:hypothetical protein
LDISSPWKYYLIYLGITDELSGTKLRTMRLLLLGGILENQSSGFVKA